jgi:hypothetical protein
MSISLGWNKDWLQIEGITSTGRDGIDILVSYLGAQECKSGEVMEWRLVAETRIKVKVNKEGEREKTERRERRRSKKPEGDT